MLLVSFSSQRHEPECAESGILCSFHLPIHLSHKQQPTVVPPPFLVLWVCIFLPLHCMLMRPQQEAELNTHVESITATCTPELNQKFTTRSNKEIFRNKEAQLEEKYSKVKGQGTKKERQGLLAEVSRAKQGRACTGPALASHVTQDRFLPSAELLFLRTSHHPGGRGPDDTEKALKCSDRYRLRL